MRHASLFSGIGGFDLAAQWMGWENIFQVEKDPFCQKVLEKNFPTVKRYGDIKEFDGTQYRGTVDILTGGFPCQPYSGAGKRKGKNDERHLWPHMLRVIREIQPCWVVGENVLGIISWSGGLVFHEVQSDLEAEGYEVFPYVLPACAKDANHRRDRVWFVAYTGSKSMYSSILTKNSETMEKETEIRRNDRQQFKMVPTISERLREWREMGEPFLVRGDDGLPEIMDRLKGLGNSVSPQVAFEIFKAIEQVSNATP